MEKLTVAFRFELGLGSLVFLIEHPDRAGDEAAVALAGVESTLRTYPTLFSVQGAPRFALWTACSRYKKPEGSRP